MFDIGSSELLLTAIVAIVVIGPKDLPRALYKVGQIMGKARAMTRHFRAGVDEMVRQVELEELEKKWAADNARIMAESGTDAPDPLFLPDTAGDDTAAQAPTAVEPKTGTPA